MERKTKLKELEKLIQVLDKENAQSPSTVLHGKIATLKYEYNKIISTQVSKAFLYTRQKYLLRNTYLLNLVTIHTNC